MVKLSYFYKKCVIIRVYLSPGTATMCGLCSSPLKYFIGHITLNLPVLIQSLVKCSHFLLIAIACKTF